MSQIRRGRDRGVPEDSLLKVTGQLWKLVLGGIVVPIAVVGWGWKTMRSIRPDQPLAEVVTHLAILAAGAVLIVGLLLSIRCPRCRGRLVKALTNAQEGADAIVPFVRRPDCPFCGYEPAKRESQRGGRTREGRRDG